MLPSGSMTARSFFSLVSVSCCLWRRWEALLRFLVSRMMRARVPRVGWRDLDLLAGVSGHVEEHGIAGDGLEVELVDVEVAGGGGVLHGEGDGDHAVGDAVFVEVLALVVVVEGAGHVLGVLDVLVLGADHGEEEVSGAGFADRCGIEAAVGVVVVDGVEVVAFEAEMEEACLRVFGGDGVELDELVVVDLDEGLVDDAVFGEVEGLLEAEFGVEVAGGGEVVDADGYMGDAVERRRSVGRREGGKVRDEDEGEE